MKRIILLLLISISAIHLYSQDTSSPVTITGIVYDSITSAPVDGAVIMIEGTTKNAVSNEVGFFQFPKLTPGQYTFVLTHVGHQRIMRSISVRDKSMNLKFQMSDSKVQLDEVVVSAPTINDQQLISSVDIQLRPINNSQEILRMVPGPFHRAACRWREGRTNFSSRL